MLKRTLFLTISLISPVAAALQYTASTPTSVTRSPVDGSLTIVITHSGLGLPSVEQTIVLRNSTGVEIEAIRGAAISNIKLLNENLTAEPAFKALVGVPLDITTPIAKTEDQKTIDAFIVLRQREADLKKSVAEGSGKQTDLDAAILARKNAYAAASPELQKTLDAILRQII